MIEWRGERNREREREREGRGRWGYFKPNDITVVNISDLQSSQITTTLCDMFVLYEQLSVSVEHLEAEVTS